MMRCCQDGESRLDWSIQGFASITWPQRCRMISLSPFTDSPLFFPTAGAAFLLDVLKDALKGGSPRIIVQFFPRVSFGVYSSV